MQLYNQYCNGMLVVAKRYVRNTMEAEDIVQESFISAFSRLDQFKAQVSFGAWLKRIVINRCIDSLKSKHQRLVELEDFHLSDVTNENESDWQVESEITVEDVNIEIEKLSEKYKYVVLLYLVEGYDHSEISDILKITEVASRTQLSRGKQKLKKALKYKQNEARY
ncbi:RNA polymerase sigma factor [uncultured Winogradskyella sp.]|uniref:RNA polymerase sigma factor n=1 Tax=Winogradskyella sp. 4-2091 TaxID=3381659 RepID=UPI002632E392|nr:RNA polymerase sigma factor [uncultured Winogradskyella sp.]